MGVATAIAIAGLGMSAYQITKGAQATAAANDAATQASNELKKISEANKFASLTVPTLGLKMAQENVQQRQTQQLQGLQDIGAAGVLGGLTAINQQGRAEDLALAAEANKAQYQRDFALAQNAQQLEAGRVAREQSLAGAQLSGSQAAAAEGRQMVQQGISGGLNALSSAASLKAYKDVYGKPKAPNTKGGTVRNFFNNTLGLGKVAVNQTPGTTTLNAMGTPVENMYDPQIISDVAGLTNQFAGITNSNPMLQQGMINYPYPNKWMNQNLGI